MSAILVHQHGVPHWCITLVYHIGFTNMVCHTGVSHWYTRKICIFEKLFLQLNFLYNCSVQFKDSKDLCFCILASEMSKRKTLVFVSHMETLRHRQNFKMLYDHIERFSFKIKTKVITLTNHNSRKQSNEPIRARSKYMSPVPSAEKRVRVNHDWFWFYF